MTRSDLDRWMDGWTFVFETCCSECDDAGLLDQEHGVSIAGADVDDDGYGQVVLRAECQHGHEVDDEEVLEHYRSAKQHDYEVELHDYLAGDFA